MNYQTQIKIFVDLGCFTILCLASLCLAFPRKNIQIHHFRRNIQTTPYLARKKAIKDIKVKKESKKKSHQNNENHSSG